MPELKKKQQEIINIFLKQRAMSSSGIYDEMLKTGENISLVTVKRNLAEMAKAGLLIPTGRGRSRVYDLSSGGRISAEVDVKQYLAIEPDKRYGLSYYNFDLFSALSGDIFTDKELGRLESATAKYRERVVDLPAAIRKKEWERLVVELSWKSSRIEGNTYTLLDTEKLILDNIAAPDRSRAETKMILNHKGAFAYIHEHSAQFKVMTRKNLEELHAILVKDLGIDRGLRSRPVGVTGSIYRPLDNVQQISEAVRDLAAAISRTANPYARALMALAGVKYIQPFADGNKRTARLMANALLLANSLSPLSYRSVDENDYREATLAFYELNSLQSLKKIFIEQYEFASRNYAVK